ncbi:unnamed protein product [Prorocentrum cordatum]|uniref:Solute carrier family 40 protein n=1 Tax=Prorocentrum cordatum TaxID=2364126 RepID=A0ABN9RIP9_9DINO|nr:unnamed protein product [Polarella glacialis]
MVGLCARRAAWWWLLLREQVLVFSTSFGALLCLAFDAAQLTRGLLGQGRAIDETGPRMLSTFFRLAVSPMLQAPKHWQRFDRLSLVVLRCALALPAGSLLATVAMGGLASLGRFAQRCHEVRDVELERLPPPPPLASSGHVRTRALAVWTRGRDAAEARAHGGAPRGGAPRGRAALCPRGRGPGARPARPTCLSPIWPSRPRSGVHATMSDGRAAEASRGTMPRKRAE